MLKPKPIISVVTPTYNRSSELDYLIKSINNQSLDSNYFEMIISDDGSTDDTIDKLKNWKNLVNFRFNYINQNNLGPGAARNHGVNKSNGELIVFIDSDCEADKDWLKIIYESYKNDNFDAFGGPDYSKQNFLPIQKAIDFSMTSFFTTGGMRGHRKQMLAKFYPRSHNMGVKKSLFEKIGGFGPLRHGQDIELSNRIHKSGAKIALLIDAIVYHRRRTTIKKFFRQVFNWGVARINLAKIDNAMLEPIHFIPSIFLIIGLLIILGSLLFPSIFLFYLIIGVSLINFLSILGGLKTSSLVVMFLLNIIIPIQIFGYGAGFFSAFIKRFILGHDEFTGFRKKYY